MQLYIKRIIVYVVVGNVDIHTLYACDSPSKYHVSHFKTLKFVYMWKALKNTDLSKTCMCVSLTEFEVCTWVTDQVFSVQIYGPMQGRSKCACHKSEGKTKQPEPVISYRLGGGGEEGGKWSHGFQRERRGNQSSPTEYKGGRGL